MFFRFAPMGKVEKTRFERNSTTFVNPAFSAAWKSPPKMVAWNQNCKIRSQACFFVSPRWGKLKKRVERNWTTFVNPAFSAASISPTEIVKFDPFVNPAFSAAWKCPPQMVAWNRNCKILSQACFFVSPRWGKLKKRVFNAIGRPSWTRLFPLLGKVRPKWWQETEIVKFDPKGVFSFRPDGESWKNAFLTQLDDLREPGFFRYLEKSAQNGGRKPKL